MSFINSIQRLDEFLIKVEFSDGFKTVATLPSFLLLGDNDEKYYIEHSILPPVEACQENMNMSSGENSLLKSAIGFFNLIIHWKRDEYEPTEEELDLFEYYKWAMDLIAVNGLPQSSKSLKKTYPPAKFFGEVKSSLTLGSGVILPEMNKNEILIEASKIVDKYNTLSNEYIKAKIDLGVEVNIRKASRKLTKDFYTEINQLKRTIEMLKKENSILQRKLDNNGI